MGAIIKNVYAKRLDRDPSDLISISIMPCTAKKDEAHRPADRQTTHSDKLDATVGRWVGGRVDGGERERERKRAHEPALSS